MKCKLADAPHPLWPGRTLLTNWIDGELLPTAVYMPPNHIETSRNLNVLLYFHGWYVSSKEALIDTDKARLCETVMNSGKDVVLVAPWLGHKSSEDDGKVLQTARFGEAGYGHRFIRAILDALAAAISGGAAGKRIRGVDAISGAGPIVGPFGIKNFVVACHSGGGVAMRNVVQTLGPFEHNLRECVGLDCLYDSGNSEKHRDEDAKFWFERAKKPGTPPAYFIFGPSTVPQSIKLYLMAKGRIDAFGNQSNPAGPALGNLTVWPGHISQVSYGGAVTNVTSYIDRVVDDLIARGPSSTAPTASGSFVKQAVKNFEDGYMFPYPKPLPVKGKKDKDIEDFNWMGFTHYFIARAFLRERLKSISLV
jgi:hypothetical protein